MDKMSEKILRIIIVVLSISFIYTTLMWANKSNELKQKEVVVKNLNLKVDSLQKVSDSLYDLSLPCQIELGRYQVAYEIFMERNPKAASQYGDIISEETE